MWRLDLSRIDPFLTRMPDSFMRDLDIEPWARYLDRFLLVMHTVLQRLSNQEFTKISVATGDTAHTTSSYERIICQNTGSLVITLNESPVDCEIVKVKRRDGAVQILGTIDGSANLTLSALEAVVLEFSTETNDWNKF